MVSCDMQKNREVVEMRNVARLKPFAKNARTHSKEQIEQLAAAIREFGFTTPILISPEGEIRAGHGRLEAARALGMTEVPTLIVGADWSPEKVRAYVIADNKLALNADWDIDLLAAELGELEALDFDISLTGFSLEEIGTLTFGEESDPRGGPAGSEIELPPESKYREQYGVIVICKDESDQKRVFEDFSKRGLSCRVVTT